MPGRASADAASTPHKNDHQFSYGTMSSSNDCFWSKQRDDVTYHQLQKFWSELSLQARQELLRIEKQTLFEQARKNMYCSRCNGLLLDGFMQIITYGKSLQREGIGSHHPSSRFQALKIQTNEDLCMADGSEDDIQDPSVHPWGGLTATRDGMLTLFDCYLYSKSLRGLQNVFDSARARERERELLYPDACGGGGRGWISQGMAGCGRGHGTRETCALHTARLSVHTLADFWSALGEDTRQSLLRMKEEDFIERLMYRFDSKRFCRDCRRNVIREFKELKELKRMRRETRCTTWFCVTDTDFQYQVSHDTVEADWHQAFVDTFGSYHHFEWAVGTGEGKSDILEFENVGLSQTVQAKGLDLGSLNSCYITVRAWKMDGHSTDLCVKAHALKGQQCVHCRLGVGDNFVTITRGENITGFFEHAEEAEEEEDDDSTDKDGSDDMDGECSRPQKHAKSPELAREFLLDAATVIFKEQVEKAFREGTARQNAHSIFVCLALKLLEERVHVAFKEISTLEKQMKLLEEEEKEKREEEERKERRRTKEREKKLRRKERLREKEKDRGKKCSLPNDYTMVADSSKHELTANADEEESNAIVDDDFSGKTGVATVSGSVSPNKVCDEQLLDKYAPPATHNFSESPHWNYINISCETSAFPIEQVKYRRKLRFRKDCQYDAYSKWPDRRRYPVASENLNLAGKHESRRHVDNSDTSRGINGLNKQVRFNALRPNARNGAFKFGDKFLCSCDGINEPHDWYVCSCNQYNDYRPKMEMHMSRVGRDCKSESTFDISKPYYRVSHNQGEYMRENPGRCKQRTSNTSNVSIRDPTTIKKSWEPMELQKKYHRSSSDSDVTLRSSSKSDATKSYQIPESSTASSSDEVTGILVKFHHEVKGISKARFDHEEDNQEGFYKVEKSLPCKEAIDEDNGLCSVSLDSSMNSSSNSDNCSSCLSEGDSNIFSSNPRNTETSSSSSDSEDASQNSEGREISACLQNGSTVSQEEGKKRLSAEEMDHVRSQIANNAGRILQGSLSSKIGASSENGTVNVNLGLHPQLHNQSVHHPIFQAPSVGYYHHSSFSWPIPPSNGGYVAYPHPNHYVFASPFGYSLNGNGHLMQYGTLQHLNPPILNRGHLPAAFQPVAHKNDPNGKEQVKIVHPGVFKEVHGEENMGRVGQQPNGMNFKAEGRKGVKSDLGDAGDTGFSLFHFGGPVALSTGFKPDPVTLKEENGVLPAELSEAVEEACKGKNLMKEYNLFEADNGLKFQYSTIP